MTNKEIINKINELNKLYPVGTKVDFRTCDSNKLFKNYFIDLDWDYDEKHGFYCQVLSNREFKVLNFGSPEKLDNYTYEHGPLVRFYCLIDKIVRTEPGFSDCI